MSAILLPCPFCGGKARMVVGLHNFHDVLIDCRKCFAETANFDVDDGATGQSQRKRNKEQAVDAWNVRTSYPPKGRL